MRYWYLLALILLTACSRETAFVNFPKLDSRHERAVSNLMRVTLKEDNRTVSLLNIIYLNAVDPKRYHTRRYFLVSLYDRRHLPLETYTITLNGSKPSSIIPLDDNDSLRTLMPLNNAWNAYYELVFNASKDTNLTLQFESGPSLQGAVTYRTDR